jgi:hypothetical protein
MKRVLAVYFSQTGQLREIVDATLAPLRQRDDFEVDVIELAPPSSYPFPWPVLRFFNTFPETMYEDIAPIEAPIDPAKDYDLVVLAYQVWFLQPSLPVTAFLKSESAKRVLKDRPVITLCGCRNMWLMAQERVKELLAAAGARLVGHVALTDEAGSVGSFLATPLWVMSGKRGPRLFGLIPRAGVAPAAISASRRFGERIAEVLGRGEPLDERLLQDLQAVKVNERLISSERAIRSGFLLWGRLLRSVGRQGAIQRKPLLFLYILWLVLMILTVVPLAALLKALLTPFTQKRVAAQKAYFGAPSGSR